MEDKENVYNGLHCRLLTEWPAVRDCSSER